MMSRMRRAIVAVAIVAAAASIGAQSGERGQAPAGAAPRPAAPQGPRLKVLVVSGGCCHDYALQGKILMDVMAKTLPVDWTVVVQGGTGTRAKFPVYDSADWAKGYDLVVHNECSADVDDEAFVRRITEGHRAGHIPAVVIHCSMHSYRALQTDPWREFLGVTTRRHTQAHHVGVTFKPHPAVQGLPETWSTPIDELYVIEKIWPATTALATAVSPEDQKEYPVVWAHEFGGARVFGTTLGHGNDTWNDPVFQDLLRRGMTWALGK
jgi:hypothetical protein